MPRATEIRSAAFALAGLLAACPAAATDWPMYAGGPRRLFFNPAETLITAANVAGLHVKWTFPTGAIVTGSPAVVTLALPGEGRTPVAFITSWDNNLYALRVRDGTALWHFSMADQPGASFPDAASADVETIDGRPRVFIAGGETVYSIDAVTGREVWHFDAGTGCHTPPGDCGFRGETNEVESSPIVAGGEVLFGMDLNENGVRGKGGFYGVDVHDGHLLWYFDLETGRPAARWRPTTSVASMATTRRASSGCRRASSPPARAARSTGPGWAARACGRPRRSTRGGASSSSPARPASTTPTPSPTRRRSWRSARRYAGLALEAAADGYAGSRLRGPTEPLHDHRGRHEPRCRGRGGQGRHLLRDRP